MIQQKETTFLRLVKLHVHCVELAEMRADAMLRGPDSDARNRKSILKAENKYQRALKRALQS